MMVCNKVEPVAQFSASSEPVAYNSGASFSVADGGGVSVDGGGGYERKNSASSSKDFNDFDSLSTLNLDESSYLKLKPFSKLDPTLARLLTFLNCFGITINFGPSAALRATQSGARWRGKASNNPNGYSKYFKIGLTLLVAVVTGEVAYDVNLRQSKLLAEQKRSTPLLTFVIVTYSWLTLVIPFICDISLILIGSHLFRFYSRTTATVCNGMFFGKKTPVDYWYYYAALILIAFSDVVGQVVLLGVWPKSIDPYMQMILFTGVKSAANPEMNTFEAIADHHLQSNISNSTNSSSSSLLTVGQQQQQVATTSGNIKTSMLLVERVAPSSSATSGPRITAYLLDFMLGENYAHSDLGVCIKIICLMIQFMHSYAFLMIIIALANHYATAINNINDNLDKYEFRKLLKQLIILRDSSEQISLMISIPFSLIIMLVFMRQIALNGVFIQSTMQPFENWAVSLQSFTCSVSIFMVFIFCDGLQSASKQTHRLKTEQTVINENRGGNQSIYEFLDYLDRLSKSIRITFFNIIAINKSSLVGLYGHILTLTFVTS